VHQRKNATNRDTNNNNKIVPHQGIKKSSTEQIQDKYKIKQEMVKMKLDKGFSSSFLGVPPSIKVRMRYADSYTHTHTSGALQTWLFRGNSVYDPDYTYTGHQPSGFDELAAFYQYYRVEASKIDVHTSSFTTDIPQIVCVRPVREIESQTNWSAPVESTRSVYATLATINIPSTELRNHATVKSLYSGQESKDQDFGALVTANPAKVWYWEIITQTCNKASTASVILTVFIEYDVIFSQKEVLSIS
jgi:hypothetical protein